MKAILVLLIGAVVGFLLADVARRREPTPSLADTMRTSGPWLTGRGVTHSEPSMWMIATQGDDGAWT